MAKPQMTAQELDLYKKLIAELEKTYNEGFAKLRTITKKTPFHKAVTVIRDVLEQVVYTVEETADTLGGVPGWIKSKAAVHYVYGQISQIKELDGWLTQKDLEGIASFIVDQLNALHGKSWIQKVLSKAAMIFEIVKKFLLAI